MNEDLKNYRHKTAMRRTSLSRPVSGLVKDRILRSNRSFFDYGCGHGTDIEILKTAGFQSKGWDPYYFSEAQKVPSDIVNLGYVLNVIENPEERLAVLREAFALAEVCLVVSVRTDSALFQDNFGDGAVTRDGAFQKIYSQAEFRTYVESSLNKRVYVVEPGIGYVFKSESAEQEFKSNRYLNRLANRDDVILKKIHETIDVEKISRLIEELGRIPRPGELEGLGFLGKRKFDSFIDKTIMPSINIAKYEENRERIREEVLQALAMTRIENHKFLSAKDFSPEFQQTVREMFGEYSIARGLAEEMLLRLGKEGEAAKVGRSSKVGKLLPEDLYVHRTALDLIPGLLKLMLSLGESLIGRVNSEIVKLSLHGKSMSFLFYGDFDVDAHPALQGSIRVDFRTGKHQVRDYSKSENPPILHRKESFVASSYEHYELFKGLTTQEEAAGLLNKTGIGNRLQWVDLLAKSGYRIEGHKLIPLTQS